MAFRKGQLMAKKQEQPFPEIDINTMKSNIIKFLKKLQPEADYKNFLVEEAELTPEEEHWFITMGYDKLKTYTNPTQLSRILTTFEAYEREYKVFKVEAQSGKVVSMKMYQYAR